VVERYQKGIGFGTLGSSAFFNPVLCSVAPKHHVLTAGKTKEKWPFYVFGNEEARSINSAQSRATSGLATNFAPY
jgi:hypothetical protein